MYEYICGLFFHCKYSLQRLLPRRALPGSIGGLSRPGVVRDRRAEHFGHGRAPGICRGMSRQPGKELRGTDGGKTRRGGDGGLGVLSVLLLAVDKGCRGESCLERNHVNLPEREGHVSRRGRVTATEPRHLQHLRACVVRLCMSRDAVLP